MAKTPVCAERTLTVHALPERDLGLPLMRQSTGTLVTCPPDKPTAGSLNLYVSQASILGMMPLLLKLWFQQADVRPSKQHIRVWHCWSAAIYALVLSCRATTWEIQDSGCCAPKANGRTKAGTLLAQVTASDR